MRLNEAINVKHDEILTERLSTKVKRFIGSSAAEGTGMAIGGFAGLVAAGYKYSMGADWLDPIAFQNSPGLVDSILAALDLIAIGGLPIAGAALIFSGLFIGQKVARGVYNSIRDYTSLKSTGERLLKLIIERDDLVMKYLTLENKDSKEAKKLLSQMDALTEKQKKQGLSLEKKIHKEIRTDDIDPKLHMELLTIINITKKGKLSVLKRPVK